MEHRTTVTTITINRTEWTFTHEDVVNMCRLVGYDMPSDAKIYIEEFEQYLRDGSTTSVLSKGRLHVLSDASSISTHNAKGFPKIHRWGDSLGTKCCLILGQEDVVNLCQHAGHDVMASAVIWLEDPHEPTLYVNSDNDLHITWRVPHSYTRKR